MTAIARERSAAITAVYFMAAQAVAKTVATKTMSAGVGRRADTAVDKSIRNLPRR